MLEPHPAIIHTLVKVIAGDALVCARDSRMWHDTPRILQVGLGATPPALDSAHQGQSADLATRARSYLQSNGGKADARSATLRRSLRRFLVLAACARSITLPPLPPIPSATIVTEKTHAEKLEGEKARGNKDGAHSLPLPLPAAAAAETEREPKGRGTPASDNANANGTRPAVNARRARHKRAGGDCRHTTPSIVCLTLLL